MLTPYTTTAFKTATVESSCGDPPTVLNGRIYKQTATSTEYECLAGFAMTGNKVITCSTAGSNSWDGDTPSCVIIDQTTKIYVKDSWWMYLMAGLLGALLLLFLGWIIWYRCCLNTRKVAVLAVGQTTAHSQWKCCRKLHDRIGVNQNPSNGYTRSSANRGYYRHTTGLIDVEGSIFFVPVQPVVPTKEENDHVTRQVTDRNTSRKDDIGTELAVDNVLDSTRSKKAKDLKIWLPHKNPLRNINTSTK